MNNMFLTSSQIITYDAVPSFSWNPPSLEASNDFLAINILESQSADESIKTHFTAMSLTATTTMPEIDFSLGKSLEQLNFSLFVKEYQQYDISHIELPEIDETPTSLVKELSPAVPPTPVFEGLKAKYIKGSGKLDLYTTKLALVLAKNKGANSMAIRELLAQELNADSRSMRNVLLNMIAESKHNFSMREIMKDYIARDGKNVLHLRLDEYTHLA